MIFEFVEDGETTKVEVDDECVSKSYINLELIEEEDEDKTEIKEES
jgi:hypothetical protein